MTQEEKELLLKDLCGRLFTGVILKQYNCINNYVNDCGDTTDISLSEMIIPIFERGFLSFRPYLRPMSSMTVEEKFEYNGFDGYIFSDEDVIIKIDWLNKHHFDYRGLIQKGLALEAPKDMYNTKT